jgi:hypothetical protein
LNPKMLGVLIGSSNIYKFYQREAFASNRAYSVVRCTDISNFNAIMMNLEDDDKKVIVSVMENFLSSAAKDEQSEEGQLEKMGETMDTFLKIVSAAAVRMPATKFSIVDPINRPKFKWYEINYDAIWRTTREGIAKMRKTHLSCEDGLPMGCAQFEADGVHLTAASAQTFLECLLKNSEAFFDAPTVTVEEDEAEMNEDEAEENGPMERLEKRLDLLESQVTARKTSDNQIFARIKEDMDWASNKAEEDRLVITGITSKTVPPKDPEERKVWIGKIVQDILKAVIPGFQGKIIFINQMKSKGQQIPMVEVKIDSVKNAADIRKAFAEKKKEKADLGRIFIANSVSLATRVRVDILKAIARKISNKDTSAHTVPFISRPVMHVRPTESAEVWSTPKTYSFVEAATRFGHLVRQVELGEAYRRAGNSFKGQHEQHFIVLRESVDSRPQQPSRRGGAPRAQGGGRKRPREDEEDEAHGSGQGGSKGYRSQARGGYARGRGYNKKQHK